MQIWNVATAQRGTNSGPAASVIQAIAISPDGAQIAATDADGRASILEVATGADVQSFRTGCGDKKSLAYSPDGRLLAGTGEDDTQIDIRDTQTGIDPPG